jgi:hypothetical protein
MVNYGHSRRALSQFLMIYKEAAELYLVHSDGRPILDWLNEVIAAGATDEGSSDVESASPAG